MSTSFPLLIADLELISKTNGIGNASYELEFSETQISVHYVPITGMKTLIAKTTYDERINLYSSETIGQYSNFMSMIVKCKK